MRGEGDDDDADEALSDFRRFPTWMWRNTAIAASGTSTPPRRSARGSATRASTTSAATRRRTRLGGAEPCERRAVEQLVELQRMAAERFQSNGHVADDGHFYAEQNARLVVDAERYHGACSAAG